MVRKREHKLFVRKLQATLTSEKLERWLEEEQAA
jgi:hypothetical protein